MIGYSMISRVELKPVAQVATENPPCGSVVNQVASMVRIESNRRVTAERRDLVVDLVANRPLQRQHVEVVLLELVLPDFGRRIDGHACQGEHLRLTGVGGNLKVIDRASRYEAEPRRRIQKVREISEARALVAGVMNCRW